MDYGGGGGGGGGAKGMLAPPLKLLGASAFPPPPLPTPMGCTVSSSHLHFVQLNFVEVCANLSLCFPFVCLLYLNLTRKRVTWRIVLTGLIIQLDCLVLERSANGSTVRRIVKQQYNRTWMARTMMAHLPWLFRTLSLVPWKKFHGCRSGKI